MDDDLNGGTVPFQSDDFSYELVLPNSYELIHGRTSHIVRHNDGPRDLPDIPASFCVR